MKTPDPSYRKLPGRGLGWSGFSTVWLAEDHLLEVNSVIFHERYRRFFLPDIGAIIIRRTRVRFYWNLAHGFIGIGGALIAGGLAYGAAFIKEDDARIPLWIFFGMIAPFAVASLILLVINVALGPTCRCHLRTASGWRVLSAPSRLRSARRFFAQVAPLVEAAQAGQAAPASQPSPEESFS
jgi:hypothetical protein